MQLTGIDDAFAHLRVTEGHAMSCHKLPQHVGGQLAVGPGSDNHHRVLGALHMTNSHEHPRGVGNPGIQQTQCTGSSEPVHHV